MNRRALIYPLVLTFIGLNALPAFGQAGEAAQVIFTNSNLKVIDTNGTERVVRQGDFIQPGERVITASGVMGQIRLPDGTLLGARPGTDFKLDSFTKSVGKNVLVLNEGNVRVINTQPPKGPKPMPVDVISPISTLHLTAGDGEAIHVKPGGKSNVEPGTYNRLQIGTALVRNSKGELPLPAMQPTFSSKVEIAPFPIAVLPPALVKTEPITLTFQPTIAALKPPAGILMPPTTIAGISGGATPFLPVIGLPAPVPIGGAEPVKTTIGTASFVGTSGAPIVSTSLTPQYNAISPITISTAALKPPPPPPPPPPKTITCTKCIKFR